MRKLVLGALRVRVGRFVLVGASAALLLFALTYVFISAGVPAFASGMLAYGIAFVAAYTAQRGWTFGGGHSHVHALPKYFVLQLGCALTSGAFGHVSVTWLQLSPLITSIATTLVMSAVSYVVSSTWVFPDSSRSK